MTVLPACISVYHMHAWCPQRSEEGIRSPGTEVMDGCGPPYRYGEINPDPLQGQHVLLTAEPYLWPHYFLASYKIKHKLTI